MFQIILCHPTGIKVSAGLYYPQVFSDSKKPEMQGVFQKTITNWIQLLGVEQREAFVIIMTIQSLIETKILLFLMKSKLIKFLWKINLDRH